MEQSEMNSMEPFSESQLSFQTFQDLCPVGPPLLSLEDMRLEINTKQPMWLLISQENSK